MKVKITNLGPLATAEFEIGDLTIICGCNNTGKTYATYATYGFLDFLRTGFRFPVDREQIDLLFSEGTVEIDLDDYIKSLRKHLKSASREYSRYLNGVFAGSDKAFANSTVEIELQAGETPSLRSVEISMGSPDKDLMQVKSSKESNTIRAKLIVDRKTDQMPSRHLIEDMMSNSIREVLFVGFFPKPFIASAERTGSAIFQKELDFTRNRLVDLLRDKQTKLHPFQLLSRFSGEYPLAVQRNVDFIRELPSIADKESFILKSHPQILDSFSDIIGGDYKISKDGDIQYIPSANKRLRLSLVESSSAVRSLLDIGFYLRHIAQRGDILMVDEPELNLHPENQRRIARLFAALVNLGVRVFVTTHSDYFVKELNTLIMLSGKNKALEAIARREGYQEGELIDANQIRVYMAKDDLVEREGYKRKKRCPTLVQAQIDPQLGIEASTFDKTIDEMNRIQDQIVWEGLGDG